MSRREIVVLDRGWIFVGDMAYHKEQSMWRLSRCKNIRRWASDGFGGLTRDPKESGAVFDDCADLTFAESAIIFRVPVSEGWGQ